MHDAFISYSRRDSKEFVGRLGEALGTIGKDLWVDLEDIPPASQWERDLRDGIAASSSFVFVISPGSVSSDHCRRELDYARDANKRIIPVVHLQVADADVPAAVASLNWIPQQGTFEDDFDGSVKQLVVAIETDLDAVRAHTRWQERAQKWRDGDRARGLLATGAELRDADAWLEAQTGRTPEPTAVQAEWIAAGRRQAARRQRRLFGAAVLALLISAALGVLALIQRNQAVEQRDTARSDELASDSIANLESDPELSLILALDAVRTKTTDRTVQTLRRAILASHVRARFESAGATAIDAAELSPDGALVASAIEDGTAVLWDSHSGDPVATLQTPAGFVSDVAFAPDGRSVITADGDGMVRTWSVPDGRELSSFRASDTTLVSAAISPDGESIAASGIAGVATVFDRSGRHATALRTRGRVNSIEFSPDSRLVLTASRREGEGARLWNAADGSPVLTVGDGEQALDAELSPDARTIATVLVNGSAAIWDARTGERRGAPLQDTDRGAFITRVAFVPGDDVVVTGGGGGDSTAWDLRSREQIDHYRGSGGLIIDVALSGDGKRLVTAGSDGTARIWDVGARTATIQTRVIATPQFSPDGEQLLYADGFAELANSADGRPIGRVNPRAAVFATAYSPDGTRFAAGQADNRAEIFDASTGERVGPAVDHGGRDGVFTVQWSADGSRLMTAGSRSGVKIWDAASGEMTAALPNAIGTLYLFGASLSPDGTRVAVLGGKHDAEIRAASDGRTLATLTGHTDRLSSISYDRAGDRIVTSSEDATARIWDAATGRELQVLNNDGNPVRSAAFNADGTLVATAGPRGELRVWRADSGLELARFAGADDWVAFSPDSRLVVGVDTVANQASVYECDVCAADLDQLEQLAQQRITREPTDQERETYLDR